MGLLAVLSAGCGTFSPPPVVGREPASVAPAPLPRAGTALALVLSGGAARGFAHVGVLQALEEHGIRPDIVVGSSAGAVVGALYASGLAAAEVDAALAQMSGAMFTDLVLPRFGFLYGDLGLVKGEKIRRFVRDQLRHELIEDFPLRFAAVATDLRSGATRVLNAGDASLAVRASIAMPGIMTPVEIGGALLADGQIASPLPVRAARHLGAHVVIAVDVLYPAEHAALTSPLAVVFQAFTISMNRLRDLERHDADVVIEPRIPPTEGQLGLASRAWLVEAGREAARAAMPAIAAALRRHNDCRPGRPAEIAMKCP